MHVGLAKSEEVVLLTSLILCLENLSAGVCLFFALRWRKTTGLLHPSLSEEFGSQRGFFILKTRFIRCVLQGRDVEAQRPPAWQLGGVSVGPAGPVS